MSADPTEGAEGGDETDMDTQDRRPISVKDLLATGGRLKRVTVDDQVAIQADLYGFSLEEGETPLRFRDIANMEKGVELLSGRYVIKEARVHANLCRRILKAPLEDYTGARQQLERSVTPEEIAGAAQTPKAEIVVYERALQELGMVVTGVKLPKPFTDKMMPVKSEKHPNNEDGLAAIQQALGPLWEGNIEKKGEE